MLACCCQSTIPFHADKCNENRCHWPFTAASAALQKALNLNRVAQSHTKSRKAIHSRETAARGCNPTTGTGPKTVQYKESRKVYETKIENGI